MDWPGLVITILSLGVELGVIAYCSIKHPTKPSYRAPPEDGDYWDVGFGAGG